MTKDTENNNHAVKIIQYGGKNGSEVVQNILNNAGTKNQKHAELVNVKGNQCYYPKTTGGTALLQIVVTNATGTFTPEQVGRAQHLTTHILDVEKLLTEHDAEISTNATTLSTITANTLDATNVEALLSAMGASGNNTTATASKTQATLVNDITNGRYATEEGTTWAGIDGLTDPDHAENLKEMSKLTVIQRAQIFERCHSDADSWLKTEIRKRLTHEQLKVWQTKTGWQLLLAINPPSRCTPYARVMRCFLKILPDSNGGNINTKYLQIVNSINEASEIDGLEGMTASELLHVIGVQTLYNDILQVAPMLAANILSECSTDTLEVKNIEDVFNKYTKQITGLGEMNLPGTKTETANVTTDHGNEESALYSGQAPPWQTKNHNKSNKSNNHERGKLSRYRTGVCNYVRNGLNGKITREAAHKACSLEVGFDPPIEWEVYNRARGKIPSMFNEQWPQMAKKATWKGEKPKPGKSAKTDDASTLAKILASLNEQKSAQAKLATDTQAQLKEFANLIGSD